MNIEEKIQFESRKLSDFYYPYYMEKRYPGAMENFSPVNTKYWQNKVFFAYKKWFERAARMFCVRKEYEAFAHLTRDMQKTIIDKKIKFYNVDAEKLIQAFLLDGFKYPQQLGVEKVWEVYLKYLPGLHNKKDEELEVVENIVGAALEIKKRGTVKDWMNIKINQRSIIENQIKFNPTLLAFSNSFVEFCEKENISIYNIDKMKQRVLNLNSEKILNKIKSFLKEDYKE